MGGWVCGACWRQVCCWLLQAAHVVCDSRRIGNFPNVAGQGCTLVLCTPHTCSSMPHPGRYAPQDRRGDGAAGVLTLPVVLGPRAALGIGFGLLAACMALAAHAAVYGGGLAWAWAAAPALEPAARTAALAAVAWVLSTPCAAAVAVQRSGFGKAEVSRAIDVSMKSVGLGTLLLALLV